MAIPFEQFGEIPSLQVIADADDALAGPANLAVSYSDLDRRQEAMEMREKVLEARKRILGEEHPDTLTSMAHLATSYSNLGQGQKAMELVEKAL